MTITGEPKFNIVKKLGKIKVQYENALKIGSEGEAQNFARMLNQLLIKHKLEMSDLDYELEIKDEPVDKFWINQSKNRLEFKGRRVQWAEDLCSIIAQAHSCQVIISSTSNMLYLIGKKSNVAIAEYIFVTMFRAAESISMKEYKKFRGRQRRSGGHLSETHGYRESWIRGFTNRLYTLFKEEREQYENTSSSTALLRLDKDAKAVAQWIEEQDFNTAKQINRKSNPNNKGYEDGESYANSINIKQGLNESGNITKQIN